ncbi:MAG: hypothetical protein WBV36_04555 [Terriglobales bacterium]|jgi:hypothetical protein
MDKQEEMILQGARNAWPHAVSISQYRLRQIADRLAQNDFLVKNKFSGGQAGYHITPKGRAQLLARDDSEFELEVDKAEAMLRMSLGMKARTPSR